MVKVPSLRLSISGMTTIEEPPALFDLPVPVEEQPCMIYAPGRQQGEWTEYQLQGAVESLLRFYQVRFHHCRDARLCTGNGFPDLVIVGPLGVLYRELKVKGRIPAVDQRRWGHSLVHSGQDWAVWTEYDYMEGRITNQIAAISDLAVMNQIPRAA